MQPRLQLGHALAESSNIERERERETEREGERAMSLYINTKMEQRLNLYLWVIVASGQPSRNLPSEWQKGDGVTDRESRLSR